MTPTEHQSTVVVARKYAEDGTLIATDEELELVTPNGPTKHRVIVTTNAAGVQEIDIFVPPLP